MIRALRRLPDDPLDVLVALRGRRGLMCLVGSWAGGGALICYDPVATLSPEDDPFDVLAQVQELPGAVTSRVDSDLPRVGGGWFGLWGYQLGRRLERLPEPPRRPLPQPDHWLSRYEWVLRQDRAGDWWFESLLPEAAAERALDRLHAALASTPEHGQGQVQPYRFETFAMTPPPAEHAAAVARAVEHIWAGDIFQANVCARLEADFDGDPLDVFCAGVRQLRPAYAAFVDTGDRVVASLSPELFLRRRGRSVLTSPIKGTVPLSTGPSLLRSSPKDRAENVMIVDLMRNDLGRVCEPGSICVPALARAEEHVGVWHLISDITGTLGEKATDADLMRACFPPGSITGAPKVRAMELINQLETTGRELYTGAIGYASPHAGLETSVAIRTLEFAAGKAWLGVGGGIVADSDPQAELAECFTKAAPLLAAIGAELAEDSRPAAAPVRALPVGDRALPGRSPHEQRPDPAMGAFTTVLARDGVPVLADAHLRRLCASATALGLPYDVDDLAGRLAAAAVGKGARRIRITISPLRVTVRAVALPGSPEAAWHLRPVVLPHGLGPHKWADRRILEQLTSQTADEPLLVDADGTVLETARSNLFVVADDGVHTPATDGRILPGVARAATLDLLRSRGIPTHEHALQLGDLEAAPEVFVTNAIRGVVPVTSCAGVGSWAVGPTTTWLRSALEESWRGHASTTETMPAARPDSRVLVVDNYDSFSHNLAQYAEELGAGVEVVRNDARSAAELVEACLRGMFTHVFISPGPGHPEDAGVSVDLVRIADGRVPILGICLGHQAIAAAYGAVVTRAARPVHGKPALIHHDGQGIFTGVDGPCAAARYHSLVVEQLPPVLQVTSHTADGTIMGIRHRYHPVEGLQAHPESILTTHGHQMIGNFLAMKP